MPFQFIKKTVGGALLASLFVTMGVSRSQADLADVIIGGGAAVIIGCATGAINCNKKQQRQRTTTTTRTRPAVNSAQRQQNMQVQSALNGFGWNVGGVDGVLGRKSRTAIGDYQRYMGYPQTGQLSDWERQNLIDGWQKYQAGAGGAYPRTMAAEGPRGLLNIGRDPNYPARYGDVVGTNYGSNNQGSVERWPDGNPQPAAVQPQIQAPQQQVVPQAQQPQGGQVIANAGSVPKLKPLKPVGQVAVSAAARCELVDQTTRIQGVVQAANMTDPNQALSEKFCEARGFAITQGGSVAAQYAVSENELTDFCSQIEQGFASDIASLATSAQDQIVPSVQATAAQLGLNDAATMGVYGQICLGIGYRLDDAEMALAGALTMVAAGQEPYGELVGHHLREGFGVNAAPSAATPWYVGAMDSLERGATPAFVPSTTPERIQVIRAALQVQNQRAGGNLQTLPKVVPVSNTLPALNPQN